MSELNPEARRLLDVARLARTPTADDRVRVRCAVHAAIVGGGAVVAASASAATSSAAGSLAWLKIVAVVLALGGVGTASLVVLGPGAPGPERASAKDTAPGVGVAALAASRVDGEAAPLDDSSAAEREGASKTEGGDEAPGAGRAGDGDRAPSLDAHRAGARTERVQRARGSASRRSREESPADCATLAEDVRLLHRAQGAWREHEVERALTLLDEHEARFPRPQLGLERAALRILVLCDLGRHDEARVLARRFLQSALRSPLRRSVEESCALKP